MSRSYYAGKEDWHAGAYEPDAPASEFRRGPFLRDSLAGASGSYVTCFRAGVIDRLAARGNLLFGVIGLWHRLPSTAIAASEHRQVELFLAGDLAELVLGTGLDLADAFLGNPQLAAELLQGLLAGTAQTEAADDD